MNILLASYFNNFRREYYKRNGSWMELLRVGLESQTRAAHLAGDVEYIDCISAEG